MRVERPTLTNKMKKAHELSILHNKIKLYLLLFWLELGVGVA